MLKWLYKTLDPIGYKEEQTYFSNQSKINKRGEEIIEQIKGFTFEFPTKDVDRTVLNARLLVHGDEVLSDRWELLMRGVSDQNVAYVFNYGDILKIIIVEGNEIVSCVDSQGPADHYVWKLYSQIKRSEALKIVGNKLEIKRK